MQLKCCTQFQDTFLQNGVRFQQLIVLAQYYLDLQGALNFVYIIILIANIKDRKDSVSGTAHQFSKGHYGREDRREDDLHEVI